LDLVGDKWTLLIVRDLAAGPRRFVELQRVLPGISTEQLRSRLNRMVADGMLTRKRYREVPPRVDYELTPRARDLMPVLGELALWGYRWAWSQPRSGERVDVGAILRLVPGLVHGEAQRGEIECMISDGHREGGPLTLTIMMEPGSSRVTEEPSERANARISGDSRAWVAAFSPGGSMSSLQVSGDRDMAEIMIGQLSRSETQAMDSIDRAVA
jgi:DNA-binding HxlR family transcriptional regulator